MSWLMMSMSMGIVSLLCFVPRDPYFIEPVECFMNIIFILLSEFSFFSFVNLKGLNIVSEILHYLCFRHTVLR